MRSAFATSSFLCLSRCFPLVVSFHLDRLYLFIQTVHFYKLLISILAQTSLWQSVAFLLGRFSVFHARTYYTSSEIYSIQVLSSLHTLPAFGVLVLIPHRIDFLHNHHTNRTLLLPTDVTCFLQTLLYFAWSFCGDRVFTTFSTVTDYVK